MERVLGSLVILAMVKWQSVEDSMAARSVIKSRNSRGN